jgi:hypothetical protein
MTTPTNSPRKFPDLGSSDLIRPRYCPSTFALSLLCLGLLAVPSARAGSSDRFDVDFERLVSTADLDYATPVEHSEEGMPIGNGRTGSLVWTTPEALHFQVNRVDLFCMGNNDRSFPFGHTSYSSGCGYVDINVEEFGGGVFSGNVFRQHLSVYDGLVTVAGNGISSRTAVWNGGDVIAVETDDQRAEPTLVNVDLRMLRYAREFVYERNYELMSRHASVVQTGAHTALSRLDIRDGRIVLVQEFTEGEFYSASAVAIAVTGRETRAEYLNESTVRLSVAPGRGKFTTLMASAVSYDPKVDVEGLALKQLDAAAGRTFDDLLGENRRWWSDFWSKAFVNLHSPDGAADAVEANYNYFLYVMASCSRGTYMPRYCGMLWGTNGDLRMWGAEYWWHNQGTYYSLLEPANRPELLDPVFLTYSRNLASYERAARQEWGSLGVWIPETTYFDGLEELPEGVAKEMQALYLGQKPWSERSAEFMQFAQGRSGMDSRWNWWLKPDAHKVQASGELGPPAWTSHILSSTAKIAYVYWLHYAYSLDEPWLRAEAYPVIKGAAEFYRNYPNLYRAADGKYHIRHVNNHETSLGSSDTPEELAAMHEVFPLAIRASEILGVDAEMRPAWREMLDNLAPIPPAPEPAEYYDLCTVGSDNQEIRQNVVNAFSRMYPNGMDGIVEMTIGSTLSRIPIAAAHLGWSDKMRHMLPALTLSTPEKLVYAGHTEWNSGVLRNRLGLHEGPGAIECERLGILSQALHLSLLQSVPPTPDSEPVNYLFPAWPREWDAQFTLAARDAFLISASLRQGKIEFVEIHSRKGGTCRVENPWNQAELLSLYRDGKEAGAVSGQLLGLTTSAGETLTLVPKGSEPPREAIP